VQKGLTLLMTKSNMDCLMFGPKYLNKSHSIAWKYGIIIQASGKWNLRLLKSITFSNKNLNGSFEKKNISSVRSGLPGIDNIMKYVSWIILSIFKRFRFSRGKLDGRLWFFHIFQLISNDLVNHSEWTKPLHYWLGSCEDWLL
jgi:hypothetical protein